MTLYYKLWVWTKRGVGHWYPHWLTLWSTSSQIFKNINKTSVRVKSVRWHEIISLVVSCIPLNRGVLKKSLTTCVTITQTVTNTVHYMFTLAIHYNLCYKLAASMDRRAAILDILSNHVISTLIPGGWEESHI